MMRKSTYCHDKYMCIKPMRINVINPVHGTWWQFSGNMSKDGVVKGSGNDGHESTGNQVSEIKTF